MPGGQRIGVRRPLLPLAYACGDRNQWQDDYGRDVDALPAPCRPACGSWEISLPLARRRKPELDFLVVEVSSFQLENISDFAPQAAALLNVTPDHLSRHGDMATYLDVKLALLRALAPGRTAVIRADLISHPAVAAAVAGRRVVTFTTEAGVDADFRAVDGVIWRREPAGSHQQVVAESDLSVRGRHNLENVMAVLALAEAAGVTTAQAVPLLRDFRTGAHRLQTIAVRDGVQFIDDSKATNVDALAQRSCRSVALISRTLR